MEASEEPHAPADLLDVKDISNPINRTFIEFQTPLDDWKYVKSIS